MMERTYTYTTRDRVENYLEHRDEGRFTILEILNHHDESPYSWLVEWFKQSNLIDSFPPNRDERTAHDQQVRLRQADEGAAKARPIKWRNYSKQTMVRRIWRDLTEVPTPKHREPRFDANKQAVRLFCLRAALHLEMPEWQMYRDAILADGTKQDATTVRFLTLARRFLSV